MVFNKLSMPIAKKIEHKFEIHNETIIDNYHWMRDPKWPNVEDKDTLDYLNAENKYTDEYLSQHKDFTNNIFEELKSKIKLEDQSLYTKKDDFYYYSRTEEDKNYPIYCRKQGNMDAVEEIILDINQLADGKSFFRIGALSISPDNKLLAYSSDEEGDEKYTIKIKSLETDDLLPDIIPNTVGDVVWHEAINGFFYTILDDKQRPKDILFHKLGEDITKDQLVFHEESELDIVSVYKSSSKDFIFIESRGYISNEIYYIGKSDESLNPKILVKRKQDVKYDIDHAGEYFYVRSNDDGAEYFKLSRIHQNNKDKQELEGFVDHKDGKYLDSFDLTQNYLILNFKQEGLPHIEISDHNLNHINVISFPDESFEASAYSTNYKEDDLRVNYSSLKRPDTTYFYDFESDILKIAKIKEIPAGFDSEEYELKREFVSSHDGVKVPVTIIYKKSLFKDDGSNPAYLTGYGSYGHAYPLNFRATILSLIDRGFVFAIAHIRGGDDMGYNWYLDAKFLKKKNTFHDFIAAVQYLADSNYSNKGNITISGGSAGGMLVGYVVNNAAEYLNSVIAHVPFVDVLNTMLDETLPLTPGEFKEWGNPKDEEYFHYMKSYSPYDNVIKQNYPNMFITAGLTDPRVTYWEASKWTAKLRDYNLSDNLILLKTNMDAGHAGASGRFDYLKEIAEEFVFILDMNNIKF